VALYALYISITAYLRPNLAPAQEWPEGGSAWLFIRKTLIAMLPPILLIVAVLGSILSGYATPTRGAALGALGAILLAAYRTAPSKTSQRAAFFSATALLFLIVIDLTGVDMRFDQNDWTPPCTLHLWCSLSSSARRFLV
jgi:TRAP-type mannitol/chloroaromatic compound transport system permease large subunit